MSKAGELKYPAGKKAEPRTAVAPRFNNAQFVQLELTDEQAKTLKATATTTGQIFDEMERMIDDGYKFTIKYDSYGDCTGVWCQTTVEGSENSGYILTGRGSSAFKALKQLMYKHHVLCEQRWSGYAGRRATGVIDD